MKSLNIDPNPKAFHATCGGVKPAHYTEENELLEAPVQAAFRP